MPPDDHSHPVPAVDARELKVLKDTFKVSVTLHARMKPWSHPTGHRVAAPDRRRFPHLRCDLPSFACHVQRAGAGAALSGQHRGQRHISQVLPAAWNVGWCVATGRRPLHLEDSRADPARPAAASPPPERLFRVFDRKGTGTIDFEEFLVGIAIGCRGTMEEKSKFLFTLHDLTG